MRIFSIFLLCGLISMGCSGNDKQVSKGVEQQSSSRFKSSKQESALVIDFEKYEVGKLPSDWLNTFTGKGKPGKWQVIQEDGNKVLAQVSQENYGYHFNLAVLKTSSYQNLELSLRFKGVKGEEDQGGGPVWRYQDANNYYIARANPLENNFRVYKVVNGRRRQLASARLKVTSGEWHSIRIKMMGDHIECYYDGEKYLDVKDKTFPERGKIGLWSKADAVTYFDDLQVKTLK